MNPVLIIGCGDIGRRVARLYLQEKAKPVASLSGVVRSEASARALAAAGIEAICADLAHQQTLQDLPAAGAVVFYFAAPPAEGDSDPLLRNFLAAPAVSSAKKIILISTTAVYGDCNGEWIDEKHAVNPQTARGRRRLDAENALRAWSEKTAVPFVILRVGGIYGPARWPLERLRKGLPVLHEDESPYTNRIHADDLAQVCLAAAERGKAGEIYNVADGQPGTMSAYFKSIARHFGLPQPPQVGLEEARRIMSAGMLSYLRESRRLDNHKLLTELQVELQYPDLEAGLAAEKTV